jgi:endonuclease YncB( thermonuclease family)
MATKRGNRGKSSGRGKSSVGGGLTPWFAAGILALGGIVAYDHWGELKPRLAATEKVAAASIAQHVTPQKPALAPAPVVRRQVTSLPVPPEPIPVVPVSAPRPSPAVAAAPAAAVESFGFCGEGTHFNCVVDGNTFWVRGAKIRIADIETPDIDPPACPEAKNRGTAAKLRLLALLNQGAFTLQPSASDADKEGLKFRTLYRQGRSIGMEMVGEGLAQPAGSHKSWCT